VGTTAGTSVPKSAPMAVIHANSEAISSCDRPPGRYMRSTNGEPEPSATRYVQFSVSGYRCSGQSGEMPYRAQAARASSVMSAIPAACSRSGAASTGMLTGEG
jgi:hypothetical protein